MGLQAFTPQKVQRDRGGNALYPGSPAEPAQEQTPAKMVRGSQGGYVRQKRWAGNSVYPLQSFLCPFAYLSSFSL